MFFSKTISELNCKYNNIEFVNIAYRPKPERATGGPNGVLKVLEECMGESFKGYMQRYIYEPKDYKLPVTYLNFIKENLLGTMTKKLLEAEYYVSHDLYKKLPIKQFQKIDRNYVFICHDIGSAVGAYNIGCPYYLIYHQQGSFVHERESFGESLSKIEKDIMNKFEDIAFSNAIKVFFPSLGARDAFYKTSKVDFDKINFGENPIYNTVTDFPIDTDNGRKFLISNGLECVTNKDSTLSFISIGDYSYNKGIDRVPDLISKVAQKTSKQVVWIVIGSKHKSGIYDRLIERSNNGEFNFKVLFIPNRLEHSLAMGILSNCDYLVMLQRYSIFDFSTLEAMKIGKKIILSSVGGNLEFNKMNNIVLVPDNIECDNVVESILSLETSNNIDVFNMYFSNKNFLDRYASVYNDAIDRFIGVSNIDPSNFIYDQDLKKLINNKEIVICGPAKSLQEINPEKYNDKTFLALNSAATANINFHIHVMQDNPPDLNLLIKYCSKNMKRVYGVINNKRNKSMRIDFEYINNIASYTKFQLSSFIYDARFDEFKVRQDFIIEDMNGVLFSALQICAHFNPKKIYFAGIDFGTQNINGNNINKYNKKSLFNFDFILSHMYKMGIKFDILSTYSEEVADIVNKYSDNKFYVDPLKKLDSAIVGAATLSTRKSMSPTYRKLRKLFRNPKLYFTDLIKKRIALLKNKTGQL